MHFYILGMVYGIIGYPVFIVCKLLVWIMLYSFRAGHGEWKPRFTELGMQLHPMTFAEWLKYTLAHA